MKKITKETSITSIENHFHGKAVYCYLISILFIVALCIYGVKIHVLAIATAASACFVFAVRFYTMNKIKNAESLNFYLTEDIVIHFRKKLSTRKHYTGYDNVYTFRKYGKHATSQRVYPEIKLSGQKNEQVGRFSIDIGDVFFLLILEEHGRKRIVKSFPKDSYELKEDDFDCDGEKYYIKTVPPIPPMQTIVDIMYDKGLDSIKSEIVKILYSKDKTLRYIVCKDEKGIFSYHLEEIYVFDEDEWKYACKNKDALPAIWHPVPSMGYASLFANEEDLTKQLLSEGAYKRNFI